MAVVAGMLKTLIEGRPPHILIEFGPNDAAGTAGCNPFHFVEFMYAAGYRMYEGAKAAGLRSLLDVELPFALSGKGRRVFEGEGPAPRTPQRARARSRLRACPPAPHR